jgi:hypothetical protein
MTTRAWTLGYPPGYEKAIRTPGNGKAPGGYAFPTRAAATAYASSHPEAARYAPYEVEMPGTYAECTTRDQAAADVARHRWHTVSTDPDDPAVEFMPECGVCVPQESQSLEHDLMLVVAPFINPDTGNIP